MSRWKDAYEGLVDLRLAWPQDSFNQYLLNALLARRREAVVAVLAKMTREERAHPNSAQIRSANKFGRLIECCNKAKYPLADVYHVALMLCDPQNTYWQTTEDRVYRGQRKQWPHIASIYRDIRNDNEFRSRFHKSIAFASHVRQLYPRYNVQQSLAIAQHYGELTQYLDVTTNPWIALFFASLKGCNGDVGEIRAFSLNEFRDLNPEGTSRLGSLLVVDVAGVHRIERQEAQFIENSHPDLIEQYVSHSISFRQQKGLVFEDTSRGITVDRLMPNDDLMLALWREWNATGQADWAATEMVNSGRHANDTLTSEDYLGEVSSWLRVWSDRPIPLQERDAPTQARVRALCEFHAKLQEPQAKALIPLTTRSFRRLSAAAYELTLGCQKDFKRVLERYMSNWPDEKLEGQAYMTILIRNACDAMERGN